MVELDWETGLNGDWSFWGLWWGDFWARAPTVRTKLRGTLEPGAFGNTRRSLYDIFFLLLCSENSVRSQAKDERDMENTNNDTKSGCNSREHKNEIRKADLPSQNLLFVWLQPQQSKVCILRKEHLTLLMAICPFRLLPTLTT